MMIDTSALPPQVASLAVTATAFVEDRFAGPLPTTEIVVATRLQLARYAVRTATTVVGGRVSRWARVRHGFAMWREARTGLACTLLSAAGVLIVVTRQALDDPRLPDYLVHEFVHAAQAERPGRREQMTECLRFDLGQVRLDEDRLYDEHLRQESEEGEAYRIQAEHAGLRNAVEMP